MKEALADDRDARVHVGPPDPWERERVFDGNVRDLTVWTQALSPDALRTLWAAGKAP